MDYKNNGLPIYDDHSNKKTFGDLIVKFNVSLPTKLPPLIKKNIISLLSNNH